MRPKANINGQWSSTNPSARDAIIAHSPARRITMSTLRFNGTRLWKMARSEISRSIVPRPCMHCEKAPCVEVCPVKASYYRDDGIVMMDYDRCIGCRYCQIACPYEARSFNWEKFTGENPAVPEWGTPEVERRPRGVPEKCSFCYQTLDRGLSLWTQTRRGSRMQLPHV